MEDKQKEFIAKVVGEIIVEKTEQIVNEINDERPSHQKTYSPGERIEQDGWEFNMPFGKVNLTLSTDSASGYACAATFGIGETNIDHLANISKIFKKYGKPMKMVFDRRAGIYGEGKAQIRDLLEKCEVEVITSSDPNAKPNVERTNRTLENDFMYVFCEKYKIRTLDKLNELSELFLDEYNHKYNKVLNDLSDDSMFLPAISSDLSNLYVTYKVKVLNDQTMHFRKQRYGFVNTKKTRIYVAPMTYTLTVDHNNEKTIISGKNKVVCTTKYKNKKVVFPNTNALIELAKGFKPDIKQLTKSEIKNFILLIDKKITQLSLLDKNIKI